MNQSFKNLPARGLLGLLLMLLLPALAWAQAARTVTGTVVDELGEPLIGVSVTIPGQTGGVTTDLDGNFRISLPAGADKVSFSYVGYNTKEVTVGADTHLNVALEPSSQSLQEMVVIGYGSTKKNDLTGSVAAISEKDFNQGVISSPEELINGKIAGVQITNSGGSPNAGATIRVRGGASLNASNDPLIVLDGVPMEVGGGIEGSGNFLSLINPNDIESMTILKDASSTAIYGSRASNGVIIITTKKGSGDGVKVSFQTTNSVSHHGRTSPNLTNAQFRDVIKTFGTAEQVALLGNGTDTDWNDEVFQDAFGTDNNISISGRAASWLPFRVALGAMYQDGILRTDNSNRYTANLNLNPKFFNDHLQINLSGKGTYAHNRMANTGAIWNAFAYDPTQPVYGTLDASGNQIMTPGGQPIFGGFHEVTDAANNPAQGAIANPVAMLEQFENRSKVWRFVGNFDVDYRLHPLPELRFHVTGGLDYSRGTRTVMNDFKIRASYGVTGQQDGIANYGYLPNYTISNPGAYYWFNGQWIPVYRPQSYNPDLRWETTRSWNFGVDFGFLNNRISGSVEYYTRKTEDLLATVPIPAGINFNKTMLSNVGNVSSKGVEISLNANIIDTKDWAWTATFNATWQENKITNLSLVPGTDAADTSVGYMEATPVMVYKTGYAPNTFKVYKQIYDQETGLPVEGLYADLNGDGRITEDDQYYYHHASPDWIFGFNTSLRWKKWTLSTALRAQVGNYVYNGNAANMGAWECVSWNSGQINNLSTSFLDTNFQRRQYASDHYVENASLLKMDNLQLSYNFGRIYKSLDLHISAMVQNVFTVTKYKGVDPESDWGIESSMYPRPRTYSLTVGLNF